MAHGIIQRAARQCPFLGHVGSTCLVSAPLGTRRIQRAPTGFAVQASPSRKEAARAHKWPVHFCALLTQLPPSASRPEPTWGRTISTEPKNGRIGIWKASDGRQVNAFAHEGSCLSCWTVAFSEDDLFVMSGHGSGAAVVWAFDTKLPLVTNGHSGVLNAAWFSVWL